MGPWLVLISPCFRENEVATCKIGSFLCSLDNLLQKNVIVFFFSRREYNLTLPAISVACPKLAQSQYNVLLNFICV